jgi:hypothetical protein
MIVKNLDKTDFNEIMSCFLKAFENYYVKMPTDHSYYKERWRMANVRLDLSFGMFDNHVLVGFIINAIDKRNDKLVAFNTGTGVIPEYRGQRIVNSIYKFAFPLLKNVGITLFALEVIKENTIAIKTYQSLGFKITKNYKCFGGKINIEKTKDYQLKKIDIDSYDFKTINQNTYSWDNHINVIRKGNYEHYQIIKNNTIESYFIINSQNGYIAQFDVLNETPQNWQQLFSAIKSISDPIKINNVDEKLDTKIKSLKHFGLNNTVDQYEMEFSTVN